MKKILCMNLVVWIFFSTFFVLAQEKKEQEDRKVELPILYLEQKLGISIINLASYLTAGISYAKSFGQKPEDYGEFLGKIFSPNWQGIKGKGLPSFIEALSMNLQIYENFSMEILTESQTSIIVRINKYADNYIRQFASDTGVSADEYYQCKGKMWEIIAEYLGFRYEQKLEENWILITVTKGE